MTVRSQTPTETQSRRAQLIEIHMHGCLTAIAAVLFGAFVVFAAAVLMDGDVRSGKWPRCQNFTTSVPL